MRRQIPNATLQLRCESCSHPFSPAKDVDLDLQTCPVCKRPVQVAEQDRQVNQYRLLQVLGQGSYGTVWKAANGADRVALKLMPRERIIDRQFKDVISEARIAFQLDHPNIVSTFEAGHSDRFYYIATQLIEGVTLKNWARIHSPTWRESTELIRKTALAAHYAHELGIIHRDLSPANIMIDQGGEPFIIDFGLSKDMMDKATRDIERYRHAAYLIRQAGNPKAKVAAPIVGTPIYMSPEQASGQAYRVSRTSDIYSLGVIYYELLTGKYPFRAKTKEKLLNMIIHRAPRHPRRLRRSIPEEAARVCLKAMQNSPDDRYPTGEALAEACAQCLHDVGQAPTRRRWKFW